MRLFSFLAARIHHLIEMDALSMYASNVFAELLVVGLAWRLVQTSTPAVHEIRAENFYFL